MMTLEVKNLEKKFPKKNVLNNVSLKFDTGSIYAVLGENGAGKSTLVSILSGSKKANNGTLTVNNTTYQNGFNNVNEAIKNKIRITHQHPILDDEITVLENCLISNPRKNIKEKIIKIFDNWNFEIDVNKKCKNLNANERFYAELLTALISNPNFLILDEPTVFLSEEERKKLYNAIKTNCNDSLNKLCTILITHKIEEAKKLCDKIIYIKKGNLKTFHVKNAITDLTITHGRDDLAQKATITLMNVVVGGSNLRDIIALRDAVYIYANTGSGAKEVMRGIVWERDLSEDNSEDNSKYTCYDNLIYLQKSKDNYFATKGKKTQDVVTEIAKKWGFSITYKYASISHDKLAFHNQYIADILISILEETKKKTGHNYVIYSEKGKIIVDYEGTNTTVFKLEKKKNAIAGAYNQTMDGMITKVQIVKTEKSDNEEDSGKYINVTEVSKNTDMYGTLQDIIVSNKDEDLSKVKEEANQTLKDHATPKEESDLAAVDNPIVKKGHQVYTDTGLMKKYYIVKAIEHDATDNIMYLEVEKP